MDISSLAIGIIVATVVGILLITLLTVGIIYWVFRQLTRIPEDQARLELERRLAAGEISPVEYEARMDALRRKD